MSNNAAGSGGIGFFELLTILLIVLKLTGFIDWAWWAVLAPLCGPLALAALLCVVYVVCDLMERRGRG